MLVGSLHCLERQSVGDCSRAMLRTGSRFWRCAKTLTRLVSSALIIVVVLGLALRPYAAPPRVSLSCDGTANCDP